MCSYLIKVSSQERTAALDCKDVPDKISARKKQKAQLFSFELSSRKTAFFVAHPVTTHVKHEVKITLFRYRDVLIQDSERFQGEQGDGKGPGLWLQELSGLEVPT